MTLVQRAIGILRKYGADAHVYLPGVGTVNGITAGNYLDSAGTTTASVDNPVGLSLDALQAMTLGSELVTNGTNPTVTTSWSATGVSVAAVSSEFQVTRAVASGWVSEAISVTVGKTYVLTATARKGTSNLAYLRVSNGANGVSLYGADAYTSSAINVPLTLTFVPAATTVYVNLGGQDLAGTVFYNNISVREIPGIHATQPTTANKPVLRRGLLNLIAYSDDQSNAAWTNANLNVTPGQASSPYGTSDSALLAPTAVSGSHVLYQNNVTIARNVTMAFIAKAGVLQFLSPSNAGADVLTSTFDLVAGTSANGASTTSSMVSLGGGWWLGAMSFTAAYTAASFYINNSGSASIASFAGNGVDGLYMYRAGLFDGTYTAQQILDAGGIPLTTTAAASNASAGKYSWQFDGSNDSLSLSAPLFQMSDDHAVIAGFNASEVNKYLFSQANSGTVSQVCSLRIENNGFPGVVWIDDAVANTLLYGPASCVGLNTVTSAIKIGNAKRFRVNGVQSGATNNTVLGTTTVNNYAIGNLNGSSFYQGSIYPVIAIKGTVSDADLLTLERWVGQLSGVSI